MVLKYIFGVFVLLGEDGYNIYYIYICVLRKWHNFSKSVETQSSTCRAIHHWQQVEGENPIDPWDWHIYLNEWFDYIDIEW